MIIPETTVEIVSKIPHGSVNMVHPNVAWQHIYDQLQQDSNIPRVPALPPYGIEGSERWLAQMIDVAGATTNAKDVIDAYMAPYRARWDAARAPCAQHRVGIVVRGEEPHFMTEPAYTWGVPIVHMLEEMGFGIDFFLKLKNRRQAREVSGLIRGVCRNKDRHTFKGFDTLDMLMDRLADQLADRLAERVYDSLLRQIN